MKIVHTSPANAPSSGEYIISWTGPDAAGHRRRRDVAAEVAEGVQHGGGYCCRGGGGDRFRGGPSLILSERSTAAL